MEYQVLVIFIFILSAAFQRISGMGFSLVSLPMLIFLMGPLDAVTLVVLMSALTSLCMVFGVRSDISWFHVLFLGLPSMIIAFPTVYFLFLIKESSVNLLVGSLLAVCTLSLVLNMRITVTRSRSLEVGVGALSGFMNAAAGVAGPAISAYAFSAGWSYKMFVATAQPYFILADIGVLMAKYILGGQGDVSKVDGPVIMIATSGCILGLWIGKLASRHISDIQGGRIVVAVSAAGSVVTLVKGALGSL